MLSEKVCLLLYHDFNVIITVVTVSNSKGKVMRRIHPSILIGVPLLVCLVITMLFAVGCATPGPSRGTKVDHALIYIQTEDTHYRGYYWPKNVEHVSWHVDVDSEHRLHSTLNLKQAKELRDMLTKILEENNASQ